MIPDLFLALGSGVVWLLDNLWCVLFHSKRDAELVPFVWCTYQATCPTCGRKYYV